MTRPSLREYAAVQRERYRSATRAEKGALLDEVVAVTGLHRKAAIRLLRRAGSRGGGKRGPARLIGAAGHHSLDGAGKRWEPLVADLAMRRLELLCFAAVIGMSAVLPGTASAQGRFVSHDRVTTMSSGQVMTHPARRPVPRPFVPHAFAPIAVFPPAAYAYGPPSAAYDQPSPSVIVSPAPPTFIPSVIEYPTGRYELQGDGITAPYRWVWIPRVPAPPPGPPEGPAAAPEARPQPAKERPQAPPKDIYRWTEDDGVTHWSDQKEGIPGRYRSKAELSFTAR